MRRGIKLSGTQVNQLDALRFQSAFADVFRNGLIVLMSYAGDAIAAIARRLGCSTFTVTRVRRMTAERGSVPRATSRRSTWFTNYDRGE